ncbi:MAG: hypothetical protein H6729_02180 [Deltaproteobacteria bacterium]|nr:hypothetical protein [Deltaproteobacteria bacterium]
MRVAASRRTFAAAAPAPAPAPAARARREALKRSKSVVPWTTPTNQSRERLGFPLDFSTRADPIANAGPYCDLISPHLDPSQVLLTSAPKEIVDGVLASGSFLALGDMPGDPDSFLCAAVLGSLRRTLGLPGQVLFQAPPPRQIRALLSEIEELQPADLRQLPYAELRSHERAQHGDLPQARTYETVVLVDNADSSPERIGEMAHEAVTRAKRVIVIDHHELEPTPNSLGLSPRAELLVWRAPEADATALMVASIVLQALTTSRARALGANTTQSARHDTSARLLKPLLAAIYSDTRGFKNAGILSHCLRQALSQARPTVRRRSGVDQAPAEPPAEAPAQRHGLRHLWQSCESPISSDLTTRLVSSIAEKTESFDGRSLGVFQLPGRVILDVWQEARSIHPDLTWSDALAPALDHFELRTEEQDLDLAIFVTRTEGTDREPLPPELRRQLPCLDTRVSIRSRRPDDAIALAVHLGGHGKKRQGGCKTNASVEAVLEATRQWMRAPMRSVGRRAVM